MDQATAPRQGAQSIERVLAVLDAVGVHANGTEPSDVAKELGLTLSTTYRMMRALLDRGYLARSTDGNRYVLGPRIAELGFAQQRQLTASPRVRDFLERLHDEQHGSTYLAVLHHDQIVIAHIADSPEHPRAGSLRIGYNSDIDHTAFAKLLLRNRSTEELALRAMVGEVDGTSAARLGVEAKARQEVVTEIEEYAPGVACLAAPVRNRRGTTVGAVAIAVTPHEVIARREDLERAVRRTALLVSAQLET